ncbi:MAG: hypothetical protein H7195_02110 [Chryseobacterium sp.]|nr:hypothetical protein [Chryseobacterium sp.]
MNKILISIALLFSGFLFSQTKIDENITVNFPGQPKTFENVAKKDTLNQIYDTTLKAYYLNSNEESYVVMRVKVLADNELEPELPKSTAELKEKYRQFIAGQLNGLSKKDLFIKDSTQINLNNYLAYKLTFKGKNSEQENGQSLILYLNGIIYEFIYSKVASYSQKNKEVFLKSIKINDSENLKQLTEPYNYWIAIAKLLLGGVFIYFMLKLIKLEKKRNQIK